MILGTDVQEKERVVLRRKATNGLNREYIVRYNNLLALKRPLN